ncbi:MAG: hypothetical protein AMXMBFR42_27400 [Burkholderiales bacterium]
MIPAAAHRAPGCFCRGSAFGPTPLRRIGASPFTYADEAKDIGAALRRPLCDRDEGGLDKRRRISYPRVVP